ncbi:hypothetical protein METH109765_02000 [Mesobacillus thioparans]
MDVMPLPAGFGMESFRALFLFCLRRKAVLTLCDFGQLLCSQEKSCPN